MSFATIVGPFGSTGPETDGWAAADEHAAEIAARATSPRARRMRFMAGRLLGGSEFGVNEGNRGTVGRPGVPAARGPATRRPDRSRGAERASTRGARARP